MIGYIEGKAVSDRVVLASGGGVGYVVARAQPFVHGEIVSLWVTTLVREESITLFGFDTLVEQACFVALCKVTGVGANIAFAVIRDAGVGAVLAKDSTQLVRTQGVGPKLAARIAEQFEIPEALKVATVDVEKPAVTEIIDTLCALGFPQLAAANAARAVVEANPQGGDEVWIAAALAHLRGAL